jgi:glutamate-ammonia-ligase adenylyltransferase
MDEKLQYPPAYDTEKADEIWAILSISHENSRKSDELPARSRALSDALFGNSPFLASIAKRRPYDALAAICEPPEGLFAQVIAAMNAPRPERETSDSLMAFLREQKAFVSLLTAAADVSGKWTLEEVTGALSHFADLATELALAHLLHTRMSAGELAWPDGEPEAVTLKLGRKSGYFILGMGKLGAHELNYSSDIDLIALYDPARVTYTGNKMPNQCLIRLTQELVQIMEKRTMHGYVFRTDLRLRPDPGATPVAISTDAAISYYHSMAVNWERSAMIKARVIAGDRKAGEDYLEIMSRWVWRKNMDFVALKDIAAIKNQINRHYGQMNTVFEGYDVKLGQGGIREIEFFAQVNQLLYAGRHPSLRLRGTLDALDALLMEGLISSRAHKDLLSSYRFLRTLEHRIQMVDDAQTHSIPENEAAIARIATFMGMRDPATLKEALLAQTDVVSRHYDALLPDEKASPTPAGYSEADLPQKLAELGFDEVETVCAIVEGWRRGRYRALRTERAKALLEQILPGLLKAFSETHGPAAALTRFDKFISQLPAGVQLFSLLQATPSLFGLLARVMGLAPALAETLAKKPALWDAVLEPDFFAPMESEQALTDYLSDLLRSAADYQDILDTVRRFVAEGRFRLGVQLLEALTSVNESGQAMTRLADVSLKALANAAEEEFALKHGHFDGGGIAVIAMGKYGGRELTSTSDLDIVFLYHVPDMDAVSDGEKPLSPSQYFSRLGQHIITAITALTPEGRLFEVDTRLRPSGQQGPLVVTLKTFAEYYTSAAWTWEHMALTRARILIAPDAMHKALADTITSVLTAPREKEQLLLHVHDMRLKLDKEFGTENRWAIKNVRGGLIDMEFICQYLMLREGHERPDIFSPELEASLNRLRDIGALDDGQTALLHEAHEFEQVVQSVLRLCHGSSRITDEEISEGVRRVLCRNTGTQDFAALKARLEELQAGVYSLFRELIETPATDLLADKE